jgi:hypothetical protein
MVVHVTDREQIRRKAERVWNGGLHPSLGADCLRLLDEVEWAEEKVDKLAEVVCELLSRLSDDEDLMSAIRAVREVLAENGGS